MTSYKTLCVVSLGSFLAIAAGFVIASEVRAGDVDEVPDGDAVDSDTLARASDAITKPAAMARKDPSETTHKVL